MHTPRSSLRELAASISCVYYMWTFSIVPKGLFSHIVSFWFHTACSGNETASRVQFVRTDYSTD